jgi:DNA-binding ferritin-like protein
MAGAKDDTGELVDALNVLQASISAECILLLGLTVHIEDLSFYEHHSFVNLIRSFIGGVEGYGYKVAEAVAISLRSETNWSVAQIVKRSKIPDAKSLDTDPASIMKTVKSHLEILMGLAMDAKKMADEMGKGGVELLMQQLHGQFSHFAGECDLMTRKMDRGGKKGMRAVYGRDSGKKPKDKE